MLRSYASMQKCGQQRHMSGRFQEAHRRPKGRMDSLLTQISGKLEAHSSQEGVHRESHLAKSRAANKFLSYSRDRIISQIEQGR